MFSHLSTLSVFLVFTLRYQLPIQEFVVKNDSPCGSTIGPGLSAELGVRTFDCGN